MTIQIGLQEGTEPTPDAFLKYLEQNWTILAAAAYSNYLRSGRGLLWVDWLNQLPVATRIKDVSVIYCTPHSAIGKGLFPEGMKDEVRRLIRQYDPETMIVIRWDDGEITRTRTLAFAGDASPLEAYEQMKGRLSEFELMVKLEEDGPT